VALNKQNKGLIVGVLAVLALGVLIAWAWRDGGIESTRPLSAPAMLPGEAA
jgi:hypothetical protein